MGYVALNRLVQIGVNPAIARHIALLALNRSIGSSNLLLNEDGSISISNVYDSPETYYAAYPMGSLASVYVDPSYETEITGYPAYSLAKANAQAKADYLNRRIREENNINEGIAAVSLIVPEIGIPATGANLGKEALLRGAIYADLHGANMDWIPTINQYREYEDPNYVASLRELYVSENSPYYLTALAEAAVNLEEEEEVPTLGEGATLNPSRGATLNPSRGATLNPAPDEDPDKPKEFRKFFKRGKAKSDSKSKFPLFRWATQLNTPTWSPVGRALWNYGRVGAGLETVYDIGQAISYGNSVNLVRSLGGDPSQLNGPHYGPIFLGAKNLGTALFYDKLNDAYIRSLQPKDPNESDSENQNYTEEDYQNRVNDPWETSE